MPWHNSRAHHAFPFELRFPEIRRIAPIGRRMLRAISLCKGQLNLGGHFAAFVSSLEIPLPGNGDRREQRPVRLRALMRDEAQHLALARPFG
jgi:hypothetical protein